MSQPALVARADLSSYRRAIVFSDLHGDDQGFCALLEETGFGPGDALVCVGDLLEKGDASLPLLRRVMALARYGHVYAVAGNNDVLLPDWEQGLVSDEDVLQYMTAQPLTILREMARELGLGWADLAAVQALKDAIQAAFAPELAFLRALPHILETPQAVFVHAGLAPGPLTAQDREQCLTWKAFGSETHPFARRVVVGHWPACNYCTGIVSSDPYENEATGVLSIDGGNNLNRWGQINYLVIEGETLTAGRLDHHPKVQALADQAPSADPVALLFPRTLVEVRQAGPAESRCFLPALGRELTIPNDQLYRYKGRQYCANRTDYRLAVRAGDVLSCCALESQGMLAIRQGVVGYYTGPYRPLD